MDTPPPATSTDILSAQSFLVQTLLDSDLPAAIGCAIAWLDPYYPIAKGDNGDDEDLYNPGYDDYLLAAWRICRDCFPDIYADLNLLIQNDPAPERLDHFICAHITDKIDVPIDDLENLTYGIPFEWYGINIDYEETWPSEYPILRQIVEALGDNGDRANIASVLSESLLQTEREIYGDIETLLCWLFASTGNSITDWTWEDAGEMVETLDWTPENVQWAKEAVAEANEILDTVHRALQLLEEDAQIWLAFKTNAAWMRDQFIKLQNKGGIPKDDIPRSNLLRRLAARCRWP